MFNETEVPQRSAFKNDLTGKKLSKKDYKRIFRVYKVFKIKNFAEYTELYMKSDIILLADVLIEFREKMISNYELNPMYSYTLPGYSWNCMLKHTGVELDLFSPDQSDMCVMFENGIHGGVSTIIHRYVEANNKYMKNFNPEKENVFIMYLDANNLYGWAMKQCLPTGNFKWMTSNKIKNWKKFLTKEGVGCTLVVDLYYFPELHDKHKDLPLAPEHFNGKLIPHLDGIRVCCTLPIIIPILKIGIMD